jgi:hypothetical protein
MLKNTYVHIGLILAVVVAGMMIFEPAEDRVSTAVVMTLMVGALCAGQWPPLSALILRHPRVTVAIGVTLVVTGPLALIVLAFWAPDHDQNSAVTGALFPTVLGVVIAVLPRSLKAAARIKAETTAQPADGLGVRVRAMEEAADAFGLFSREREALVQIVGPWLLLFCLLPFAFVDMTFWKGIIDRQLAVAAVILLLFLLAMLCLPLIAAIQWGRFLATGRRPRALDVPLGALWGFVWRLFFAGIILRVISSAEPWLKAHLPAAAPWMVDGLSGLFSLLVLVLVSPWGIVFVAVALGAEDKSTSTALRVARGTGRRFYLGMLLILSPIIMLSWLANFAPKTPDLGAAQWAIYFGRSLAMFATLIVATTYLTRAYLRSPANSWASAPA